MTNFGLRQLSCFVAILGLIAQVELAQWIDEHPQSQSVIEGQRARFRCTVRDLPLNHTVQWTVDGQAYGPWTRDFSVPFNSYRFSYLYPKECDPSEDEYDLDIDAVSWEHHSGSRFLCQLPDSLSRESSRAAILKVLVPPRSLTITPVPVDEIIYIPHSDSAANISCATGFVTPGSRIEWTVDDDYIPGEVHSHTKTNKNGDKLERLSSVIGLFVPSNRSNESSAGKQYYSEATVKDMLEHRVNVNGYYRAFYQVICRVSNPALELEVLSETFWVVFQGESAALSEEQGLSDMMWILIAIGISVLLALFAVVVGCFMLRSQRQTGADAYAPKIECVATYIEDQGVCSSVGSDKVSESSTLRPHPTAKQIPANYASVHNQQPAYVDISDAQTRPPAPASVSNDTFANASNLRNDAIRFLVKPFPASPNSGNLENIEIASVSGTDSCIYTLPRRQHSMYAARQVHSQDRYRPMSDFGSLPRRGRYRQQSISTSETTSDLPLPPPPPPPPETPPPADGAAEIPLPMPLFDNYPPTSSYEPKYNVVSQCGPFKTFQRAAGRSDGEGMSDPSPVSISSGPNFALSHDAPGSLV